MASLKINIVANYISQIYVMGVGILILPLYIKYMGAEAYGLIGFFTMLQAWFNLLDMGLTPTISRETARYHGGTMTALAYRQLFRALSMIFSSIALVGAVTLIFFSGFIAKKWLQVEEINVLEVVFSVEIMAVIVAMRWMGGLYRGIITGAEQLVWLGGFKVIIATLRFIVVFLTMWLYGYTPLVFFTHQLIVAIIEFSGLCVKSNSLLPLKKKISGSIGWSFKPIKPVLNFALSIAFTSSIWVLVTQTDKLILSGILSLKEYGYFTLAVLVASGIITMSSPVSTAIMPRMARLYAEEKRDEMLQTYRNATQLVTVFAVSAGVVMTFCVEPLLFAWTGDRQIAKQVAPILRLYAIGNVFLVIGAFPYYLQYAMGYLKYHLIGNVITLIFLIPSVALGAAYFGGVGAGYAWLLSNCLFLLFWVYFVHNKLAPELHWKWLLNDVFKVAFPVTVVSWIFSMLDVADFDRFFSLAYVGLISVFAILVAIFSSSYVFGMVKSKVDNEFK